MAAMEHHRRPRRRLRLGAAGHLGCSGAAGRRFRRDATTPRHHDRGGLWPHRDLSHPHQQPGRRQGRFGRTPGRRRRADPGRGGRHARRPRRCRRDRGSGPRHLQGLLRRRGRHPRGAHRRRLVLDRRRRRARRRRPPVHRRPHQGHHHRVRLQRVSGRGRERAARASRCARRGGRRCRRPRQRRNRHRLRVR